MVSCSVFDPETASKYFSRSPTDPTSSTCSVKRGLNRIEGGERVQRKRGRGKDPQTLRHIEQSSFLLWKIRCKMRARREKEGGTRTQRMRNAKGNESKENGVGERSFSLTLCALQRWNHYFARVYSFFTYGSSTFYLTCISSFSTSFPPFSALFRLFLILPPSTFPHYLPLLLTKKENIRWHK